MEQDENVTKISIEETQQSDAAVVRPKMSLNAETPLSTANTERGDSLENCLFSTNLLLMKQTVILTTSMTSKQMNWTLMSKNMVVTRFRLDLDAETVKYKYNYATSDNTMLQSMLQKLKFHCYHQRFP